MFTISMLFGRWLENTGAKIKINYYKTIVSVSVEFL